MYEDISGEPLGKLNTKIWFMFVVLTDDLIFFVTKKWWMVGKKKYFFLMKHTQPAIWRRSRLLTNRIVSLHIHLSQIHHHYSQYLFQQNSLVFVANQKSLILIKSFEYTANFINLSNFTHWRWAGSWNLFRTSARRIPNMGASTVRTIALKLFNSARRTIDFVSSLSLLMYSWYHLWVSGACLATSSIDVVDNVLSINIVPSFPAANLLR